MKIELTKPISYKNTQVQTLDLDLESLTGRDLIDAETALKSRGQNISAWEYSRSYLIAIAAKSVHMPPEVLEGMTASDFTKVINEVLTFLAGQVSAE